MPIEEGWTTPKKKKTTTSSTLTDYYKKKKKEEQDLFANRAKTPVPPPPPKFGSDPGTITETESRINRAAQESGIPQSVLMSMYQQTGYALQGEDLALLADLKNQGLNVTQIDPRTGSFTTSDPSTPATVSYPSSGGGGGGGGGAAPSDGGYKMFKWTEGGYEAEGGNVPSWWQAFVPEEVTPETSYGAMLNAMIPYLSPQDQVRVAHSLYGMFDTEMSHYKPGYIPEISTVTEDQMRYMKKEGRPLTGVTGGSRQKTLATGEVITTRQKKTEALSDEMRRYYQSSDRAQDAIKTLSNMREAMVQGNRWKLGPGYKWLQNMMGSAVGTGAGGQSGQTRLQYQNMLSAIDPFLSQAGSGELQPFGPLGQMATKPFYTAGSATPSFANNRFGTPNRRFF